MSEKVPKWEWSKAQVLEKDLIYRILSLPWVGGKNVQGHSGWAEGHMSPRGGETGVDERKEERRQG